MCLRETVTARRGGARWHPWGRQGESRWACLTLLSLLPPSPSHGPSRATGHHQKILVFLFLKDLLHLFKRQNKRGEGADGRDSLLGSLPEKLQWTGLGHVEDRSQEFIHASHMGTGKQAFDLPSSVFPGVLEGSSKSITCPYRMPALQEVIEPTMPQYWAQDCCFLVTQSL